MGILTHIDFFIDKRNSTGNLYFADSNGPEPLVGLSNQLQGNGRLFKGLSGSQPVGMRDSTSSLSSVNSEAGDGRESAASAVSRELRTAAGIYTNRFSHFFLRLVK